MKFEEFYQKFGKSFRTKHLNLLPAKPMARLKWSLKNVLGSGREKMVNKRFCVPPETSGLPDEFIRLEPWEGEYLFQLAHRAKKGIVEIGRYYGGSTFLLACANQTTPIYSFDLAPQNDPRLQSLLDRHRCGKNVQLTVGDSQKTDYPEIDQIDLLFIDGDHSYEGCTNDLENWYHKVSPGGHVLLHDCYFGCDVQSSVVDFIAKHDVQLMRSPYIIASHWQTSYGSMMHFVKPAIQRTEQAA